MHQFGESLYFTWDRLNDLINQIFLKWKNQLIHYVINHNRKDQKKSNLNNRLTNISSIWTGNVHYLLFFSMSTIHIYVSQSSIYTTVHSIWRFLCKHRIDFHRFFDCIKSIGLKNVLCRYYSMGNFLSPFVLIYTAVGMILCVYFLMVLMTRHSPEFFFFFLNRQENSSMSNPSTEEWEVPWEMLHNHVLLNDDFDFEEIKTSICHCLCHLARFFLSLISHGHLLTFMRTYKLPDTFSEHAIL